MKNIVFYNISDPEELLMGKMAIDKLEKDIQEKEDKEFVKPTIENFINSLKLTENIFSYNKKENNYVIPYSINKYGDETFVFYAKTDDKNINKEFYSFIENYDNWTFNPKTIQDLVKIPTVSSLNDLSKLENIPNPLPQKYIVKNNNIYTWE